MSTNATPDAERSRIDALLMPLVLSYAAWQKTSDRDNERGVAGRREEFDQNWEAVHAAFRERIVPPAPVSPPEVVLPVTPDEVAMKAYRTEIQRTIRRLNDHLSTVEMNLDFVQRVPRAVFGEMPKAVVIDYVIRQFKKAGWTVTRLPEGAVGFSPRITDGESA